MTKPIIKIHNVETGEILEREMTKAELDQTIRDQIELESEIELQNQKTAEKAALLAKLGISQNEAKLLLS